MIDGITQRHYRVEKTPPPGTGILVEWGGIEPVSGTTGDFDDLPYQPTDADLLQGAGVTGAVEAGGYHGCCPGDPAKLTDSTGPGDAGEWIIPRDFAYDQPAIVMAYTLPEATDIQEVLVFSSWSAGRVWQTYDLEFEPFGGGAPVRIASVVRSGPWGDAFGGTAKSFFTRVYTEDGSPLALGAGLLRFYFYDVSDLASPDNVYQPPAQAFQSPIIWEVEAFGPPTN